MDPKQVGGGQRMSSDTTQALRQYAAFQLGSAPERLARTLDELHRCAKIWLLASDLQLSSPSQATAALESFDEGRSISELLSEIRLEGWRTQFLQCLPTPNVLFGSTSPVRSRSVATTLAMCARENREHVIHQLDLPDQENPLEIFTSAFQILSDPSCHSRAACNATAALMYISAASAKRQLSFVQLLAKVSLRRGSLRKCLASISQLSQQLDELIQATQLWVFGAATRRLLSCLRLTKALSSTGLRPLQEDVTLWYEYGRALSVLRFEPPETSRNTAKMLIHAYELLSRCGLTLPSPYATRSIEVRPPQSIADQRWAEAAELLLERVLVPPQSPSAHARGMPQCEEACVSPAGPVQTSMDKPPVAPAIWTGREQAPGGVVEPVPPIADTQSEASTLAGTLSPQSVLRRRTLATVLADLEVVLTREEAAVMWHHKRLTLKVSATRTVKALRVLVSLREANGERVRNSALKEQIAGEDKIRADDEDLEYCRKDLNAFFRQHDVPLLVRAEDRGFKLIRTRELEELLPHLECVDQSIRWRGNTHGCDRDTVLLLRTLLATRKTVSLNALETQLPGSDLGSLMQRVNTILKQSRIPLRLYRSTEGIRFIRGEPG
jgi:hypothetical protein